MIPRENAWRALWIELRGMNVFHLVARAYRREVSLDSFPLAADIWAAMRHAFPDAIGAVLMPDHIHLIAPRASAAEARSRFARVLSGARRHRQGGSLRWEPTALPVEVQDRKHLRRQLRYLALNPCRNRLVRDPLEWLWSTHRDVVGASVDPWVTSAQLAEALGEPPNAFAARWHAYVSGDPAVAVSGTSFPVPAQPSPVARHPLSRILAATAAAHRVSADRLVRRGRARTTFLALAHASGWTDLAQLAQTVGASRITAWRHADGVEIPAAAWLCLGDGRLFASR